MRRLVNRYEEIAHGEIKIAADRWSLSVYPKVRVADVISLNQVGAIGELRRYGLQSHFDFVVCREKWRPIYAVEFDGRFHASSEQRARCEEGRTVPAGWHSDPSDKQPLPLQGVRRPVARGLDHGRLRAAGGVLPNAGK